MSHTQRIQQLERQLTEVDAVSEVDVSQKIDLLNELAWALRDTDLKRAYTLSEEAHTLAGSSNNGNSAYRVGLAYSLRTMGYLNMRQGDYPTGMSHLLKAQDLCQSLKLDEPLADIYDGLCGICFHIGNLPDLFSYAQKQLEAARHLNDSRLIINAYNNLAIFYFETGDYEQFKEMIHHNLQVAKEINYPRTECVSHINLAHCYFLTADYDLALEHGLSGLRLSRERNFEQFEIHALHNVAQVYLKTGDAPQAISYLEEAVAPSQTLVSQVTESQTLLALGEAYRDIRQMDRALAYAQQGVAIAEAINSHKEVYQGHLLLSEMYEQQEDATKALYHLKQHQTVKELVFNEKADQRLKTMRVIYDTETAKREAEIHQLQNVELKREIEERQRREEQLQLLESVVSNTKDAILIASADLVDGQAQFIIYANEALAELTGYSRQELIGQSPRIFQGPKTDADAVRQIREAVKHHQRIRTEVINYTKTGDEFWVELDVIPMKDEAKQVFHWVAVRRDISQRKQSELQLQRANADLQRTETALRDSNDKLEQRVKARTADMDDTITLLQQEIEEREQAQTEIRRLVQTLEQRLAERTEELATFFDLTLLAAQAADLNDVFELVLLRILEVTHSRAICLHLADPDCVGMDLVAQQNLPEQARTQLQCVELPPDFRHWLQQPNDPLTTTALSQLMILPPAFRLPDFQTYLGAQIKAGGHIEGVLSCYRFTDRGFGLDEISLITALAEQISMMIETYRLRQKTDEMAVLQERQRLARDLHDSVTQALYSLTLLSRAGREAAEDGDRERMTHSMTRLERNSLHALREMRLLLYQLRPADLEQEGLVQAIELRLNTVERRVGLQLDVRLEEFSDMPPGYELELYHIIMEAMNNVIKHATATHLTLHMTRVDRQLHLLIADDGRGFEPTEINKGLGLKHMRERVARLNGQISISSQPGQGTRLEAIIPCATEDN